MCEVYTKCPWPSACKKAEQCKAAKRIVKADSPAKEAT